MSVPQPKGWGHPGDIVCSLNMWNRGFGFGGRRRGSTAIVLLLAIPMLGYRYMRSEIQKGEEYSGTIVGIYSQRSFFIGRTYDHYWDVRTAAGDVHSAIVSSRSEWSRACVGDAVVKQGGSVNPEIVGRR